MIDRARVLFGLQLFAATLVATIFIGVGKASAQATIEVSPARSLVEVDPGDVYVETIRIRNNSPISQTFSVRAVDFTVDSKEGTTVLIDDGAARDASFSMSEWISFSDTSFELEPGLDTTIDAVVNVPLNAEAGGRYASVLFTTEAPESTGQSSIGSVGAVGMLLLAEVSGDIDRSFVLSDFVASESSFLGGTPTFDVFTTINNQGNVHVVPVGEITVSGGLISADQTITFNEGRSAVLPKTPPREFINNINIESSGIIPAMGSYTLTLNLVGVDDQVIQQTVSIFVLPIGFLALVIGGAVVALFILWRVAVSFKK